MAAGHRDEDPAVGEGGQIPGRVQRYFGSGSGRRAQMPLLARPCDSLQCPGFKIGGADQMIVRVGYEKRIAEEGHPLRVEEACSLEGAVLRAFRP